MSDKVTLEVNPKELHDKIDAMTAVCSDGKKEIHELFECMGVENKKRNITRGQYYRHKDGEIYIIYNGSHTVAVDLFSGNNWADNEGLEDIFYGEDEEFTLIAENYNEFKSKIKSGEIQL